MKYCSHCGQPVDDNAVVCVKCGCAVNAPANDDAPSAGMAVLGFFIPLVGFIFYLIDKETHPLKAKSAGKGALIGFIAGIVLSVIYGVVMGSMLGSMLGSIAAAY